jgi:PAS domain S-box-containing protein
MTPSSAGYGASGEYPAVSAPVDARVSDAPAAAEGDVQFRLLADAMPQLVWMADARGDVTYYNSRASEYGGIRPTTDSAWEWAPAVHPDDRELTVEAWTAAVRSGDTYQCEHRVRMSDGEFRWHLSRGVPLRNGDRVVQWFGTATDIHSVKTAEQELQAAARNKDEFLAVLAHELRNPLAPIRNALELLRGLHDDDASGRLHAMLDRQLSHMVRLVDDLLEISRISRGDLRIEPRLLSLADVLDTAVESVTPALLAGRHSFQRTPVPASIQLSGDPVRLAQAFGNLLHNAIKFTPSGGRILLEVDVQPTYAEVRVEDTGIGIEPEALEDIFGMFVQVQPGENGIRSGLGVGLALVRRVVELHGGSVQASSGGVGAGARFVVRLPRPTG